MATSSMDAMSWSEFFASEDASLASSLSSSGDKLGGGSNSSSLSSAATADSREKYRYENATRLPRDQLPIFGRFPVAEVAKMVLCKCSSCECPVRPEFLERHIQLHHSSSPQTPRETEKAPARVNQSSTSTPARSLKKSSSTNRNAKRKAVGPPTVVSRKPEPVSPPDSVVIMPKEIPNITIKPLPPRSASPPAPRYVSSPFVQSRMLEIPTVTSQEPMEEDSSPTLTPAASAESVPPIRVRFDDSHLLNAPGVKHVTVSGGKITSPGSPVRYTTGKNFQPLAGRSYNPDIHCGVVNERSSRLCLRSLTCKIHTLTAKRAVRNRSQSLDTLLKKQKARKPAAKLAMTAAESQPVSTASLQPPEKKHKSGPANAEAYNPQRHFMNNPRASSISSSAPSLPSADAESVPFGGDPPKQAAVCTSIFRRIGNSLLTVTPYLGAVVYSKLKNFLGSTKSAMATVEKSPTVPLGAPQT